LPGQRKFNPRLGFPYTVVVFGYSPSRLSRKLPVNSKNHLFKVPSASNYRRGIEWFIRNFRTTLSARKSVYGRNNNNNNNNNKNTSTSNRKIPRRVPSPRHRDHIRCIYIYILYLSVICTS